ncbi:MAG: heme ABC exporter ATP-binding protein CcmA [Candidatus Eisenbacteria bacterium]
MSGEAAVRASGLVRRFGYFYALKGLDFEARAGEIVLVLGPNGAGKTTLLRIAGGLLLPSEGEITVLGEAPRAAGGAARARIGFLSHNLALYPDLTAAENLRFFARLYRRPSDRKSIDEGLAEVDLAAWGDESVRNFSRGMKQRLALARVFLHEPDVFLLDEPFTGLDLTSSLSLAARLEARRAAGAAILLASHRLESAAPLGSRAVVIKRGKIAETSDFTGLSTPDRIETMGRLLREAAS